jgi:hypothetical protein
MWFYPVPGIISICGWIYVLVTAGQGAGRSIVVLGYQFLLTPVRFACCVLLLGTAVYMVRAKRRGEWPFENEAQDAR